MEQKRKECNSGSGTFRTAIQDGARSKTTRPPIKARLREARQAERRESAQLLHAEHQDKERENVRAQAVHFQENRQLSECAIKSLRCSLGGTLIFLNEGSFYRSTAHHQPCLELHHKKGMQVDSELD
eukprot:1152491-Pelagomonas_calceolata.AAC.5